MEYPIVEIFDSIQGEGCQMGKPCTFVRFAGCNLACPWCDTKESWKTNFPKKTVEEIVQECSEKYVVFTGGEPCMQELKPLILCLQAAGHVIGIETNGTLDIPDGIDWVTVSPKPMAAFIVKDLDSVNELKFVIDKEFSPTTFGVNKLIDDFDGPIWLQPEGYTMQESWKKCLQVQKVIKDRHPDVRIGIQLHKVVDVK